MFVRISRQTALLIPLLAGAVLVGADAGAQDGAAAGSPTLGSALKQGTFGLKLNYRFESVADDGFEDDGLASTLRTVLRYRSAPWHTLAAFVEMENVADVGLSDHHNSAGRDGRPSGVSDRPVIADPAGTAVNQVYLDLGLVPRSSLKAGRQEILLGNQRYVGNVGWRQHHQSFDAVSLSTRGIPSTVLTYAYVAKVHRIFGDTQDMASHLLQAEVMTGTVGTLSGYGFLLDYDDAAQRGLSTATWGLRFAGGRSLAYKAKGLWDVEIARQRDWGDNPDRVAADYWRAELGVDVGGWVIKIGQEVLEGDASNGRFTTPLATLHAWNGWADRFLVTPVNGLEDTWLLVSTTLGGAALSGIYHRFEANSGGADYGSELDFLALYTTPWKQKFGLKIAAYQGDEYSDDVTKAMVWTSWVF